MKKKCIDVIGDLEDTNSCEEAAEGAQREKITNFDI
jgi:hypothetical protein